MYHAAAMSLPPEVVAAFAARSPAAASDLSELLSTAWAAIAAAWPELAEDPRAFFEAVAPRLDPDAALAELAWPDLALADACLRRRPWALAAFEARHGDELAAALRAAGVPADARGEALQRLRLRLFVAEPGAEPRLVGYAGRGPLRAWLRVAAVREALMLLRAQARRDAHEVATEDGELFERAVLEDDPELLLVRERSRGALREALVAALATLDQRERTLLRLSLRDRLGVEQIGALFQVHKATAARWLAAVRTKLRDAARGRLAASLGLGARELESLIRAVGSRLDLSLAGQLDSPPT